MHVMTDEPTNCWWYLSCLDLAITNDPDKIISTGTRKKISESCDHKPTFSTLSLSLPEQKSYKLLSGISMKGIWKL